MPRVPQLRTPLCTAGFFFLLRFEPSIIRLDLTEVCAQRRLDNARQAFDWCCRRRPHDPHGAVGPGFGAKRKAPVAGLEQVDPLRLVKSPASPTRQLLGAKDAGK